MIRGLALLASTRRGNVLPCSRQEIAGVETLVARPSTGSGPVIVFANLRRHAASTSPSSAGSSAASPAPASSHSPPSSPM